jgi:hypothetical protein
MGRRSCFRASGAAGAGPVNAELNEKGRQSPVAKEDTR